MRILQIVPPLLRKQNTHDTLEKKKLTLAVSFIPPNSKLISFHAGLLPATLVNKNRGDAEIN